MIVLKTTEGCYYADRVASSVAVSSKPSTANAAQNSSGLAGTSDATANQNKPKGKASSGLDSLGMRSGTKQAHQV